VRQVPGHVAQLLVSRSPVTVRPPLPFAVSCVADPTIPFATVIPGTRR
jgi:hypothetical protein